MLRNVIACVLILLLAGTVSAVPVDPDAANGIAAVDRNIILCTSGEAWQYDWNTNVWNRVPEHDSPVPVSEIQDWTHWTVVTIDGHYWQNSNDTGDEWMQAEQPVPCVPPVQSEVHTFGDVKSTFR